MRVKLHNGAELLACKDCRHCMAGWLERLTRNYEYVDCALTRKEDAEYDPISGEKFVKVEADYCSDQRGQFGECGPAGRHWAPRRATKENTMKLLKKDPS